MSLYVRHHASRPRIVVLIVKLLDSTNNLNVTHLNYEGACKMPTNVGFDTILQSKDGLQNTQLHMLGRGKGIVTYEY